MSISYHLSSYKTKKLCKELIKTKSEPYTQYAKSMNRGIRIIRTLIGTNLLFDPLAIIALPLGKSSKSLWFITLLLIIFSIISFNSFFKKKNIFKITADWQAMINESTYPEELELSQVKNQLTKNKKAVKTTIKVMGYIFSIIIIGALEDRIRNFFIYAFNAYSWTGWYILIVFLLLVIFFTLWLSSLIVYIPNTISLIYNSLKNILNKFIENGLFVKDYALLYAAQKILEGKTKQ